MGQQAGKYQLKPQAYLSLCSGAKRGTVPLCAGAVVRDFGLGVSLKEVERELFNPTHSVSPWFTLDTKLGEWVGVGTRFLLDGWLAACGWTKPPPANLRCRALAGRRKHAPSPAQPDACLPT